MTRVLALALLAACGYPLPEPHSEPPADVVSTLTAEWRAAGLLWSDGCDDAIASTLVHVAGDAGLGRLCKRCPPGSCPGYQANASCPWGCAASCVVTRRWGPPVLWPLYPRRALIVAHDSTPTRAAVAHELGHVLSRCAYGEPDPWHGRAGVWRVVERVAVEVTR